MSIPAIGSVLTLECLGDAPGGPRFLDGRTVDSTVGLTGDSVPSGTQWALTSHAQDVVTLKCMGDIEGARFLDGRTADRTVGLALNTMTPNSGTRWAVSEVDDGVVTLRCLGLVEGDRFLDGRTMNATVGLAPDIGQAFTGTRWRIRVTGRLVMIFCLGHIDGSRFLNGQTGDQSVGLAQTTDRFPGTRWHLIGDDDSFTLKCLGAGGGPWFLDGDTVGGLVRLAPHTGAPFSGTRWQRVDLPSGESALRCQGDIEGFRFLDGRTIDGTVALIGSADSAHTGSRWRILTPCPSSEMRPSDALAPSTVRVAQLTGSNDAENRPILNNTKAWGARGLDLGANCEHSDGRLYLFPSDVVQVDTEGAPARDTDLVAWIDAPTLGGHEAAGYNFALPYDPTPLQGEHGWRYCRNCRALFFDGDADKGVCPAGEGHASDGAIFVVPFEPTNVSGQRDCRRCTKCRGMFFELYADRGVCPAGGKHVGEGKRFVLPRDDVEGPHQANWRFCQWCRGLFFDGDPIQHGACVAGGTAFRLHPVMNGMFFDPFKVAGPIQETLNSETPTGAFSYDERMYVFIWIVNARDQTHPEGSYLVSKPDPNHAGPYGEEALFSNFHTAPKGFWQVAPWSVKNADIPGLPSHEGDGLLMFGQGKDLPEADAVHLAWMPLRTRREALLLGGRAGPQLNEIQYRTKHPANRQSRAQRWSSNAADAGALFSVRLGYTSLSVAWVAEPQRWILLYSKANNDLGRRDYSPTASVVARIGTTPWDWSDEIEIFNPCREQAYGCYMHWPGFERIHKDVAPEMNDEAGWSYGAFMLNRFTKWHPATRMLDIYYLLSLHRPYQAQVMLTKLHLP